MTRAARARLAAVLGLEVALLEAEVTLRQELIRSGVMPANARREPTLVELAAQVRFAELDRIVVQAAGLLVRHSDRVRDHVLDGLATGLADVMAEPDPYRALAALDALTDPTRPDTIPGLRQLVDDVTAQARADLIATAAAGHAEALEEARRQGIPDRLLPPPLDEDLVASAAEAQAGRVAKAPASRLLQVAAEAGQRAAAATAATGSTVLEAALDAAENASRAGVEDTARQAANVTHGLGRSIAQQALPSPREVYASELLDSSTCGPCAAVDGRTYHDLEAGLVDYPGAGGYIGCDGGARCRGTLVLVHATEAGPTLDNPGAGPSPAPVDRTPQGPTGAGRPDYIDDQGNVIPTPPDPGVPDPTDLTLGTLDDQGRTVIPGDQLEPTVDTVPPSEVPRDPELATYSDDELDRFLVDESQPLDRRMAAADELDQRAAGARTRIWEEEQLDDATLAAYEAQREAWEEAGGWAADLLDNTGLGGLVKGKGRRIDRVRSAWTEELGNEYLRAEDATRGYFIAAERRAEFEAKYGTNTEVLFEGPARVAYYYSSPELRDYWDTLPNGRPTFAEFAVSHGVTDAKTLARAKTAAEARHNAWINAGRTNEQRAKRKAQADAKRRRRRLPQTAGDRLEAERARRDRLLAADRKLRQQLAREAPPPDAPTS